MKNNKINLNTDAITLNANETSVLKLDQKNKVAKLNVNENSIQIDKEINIECGQSNILLSKDKIILKAGNSSIEISSQGVKVKSMKIDLG